MIDHLATREDAIAIARDMQRQLPVLAKGQPPSASGRIEYTRAVWNYFESFRIAKDWGFSPATCPTKGRAKGEYLTDFSLYDEKFGYRIACESEWGDIDCIRWAFDKLKAVKADIKILIFQWSHCQQGLLPQRIDDLFKTSLASCGHHHPRHEFYIFIQFDGEHSRGWLWEPKDCGPFNNAQIEEQLTFESIC